LNVLNKEIHMQMKKTELAELVAKKVQNTQERLALKRIPFAQRTSQQHSEMLWRWSEGSILKEQIRHLGLAYAFLRGRRYWVTERFTKDGPYATQIAFYAGVTVEEIEAWLAALPSQEELDAYAQHLTAARERAQQARLAARARRTAA
jgi:hypothetical protein